MVISRKNPTGELKTLNTGILRGLEDNIGSELVPKFLSAVKVEVETTVEMVGKMMSQSDLASVRDHAHRIKASSQAAGLEALATCTEKLEYAARDANFEAASKAAAELPVLARAALAEVQKYLDLHDQAD